MPLLAIPNVSEGRDEGLLGTFVETVEESRARVLDVHSDAVHGRSVLTCTGDPGSLARAMVSLAVATLQIDLTHHEGVHPRMGVFDVCPFVPVGTAMEEAVRTARATAEALGAEGFPVYLYGKAATRDDRRELPSLRRGGLPALRRALERGDMPDAGPAHIDPRRGVACVGARGTLIAFNVWLKAPVDVARRIAAEVRTSGGGPPGIRALGFGIDASTSQVSMNLVDPDRTDIGAAFSAVDARAKDRSVEVFRTEVVGLPPARYLPRPDATAARLMDPPGRSLESLLDAD